MIRWPLRISVALQTYGEIARDKGQTRGLWHKACDEEYLEGRFQKEVL